MRRRILYYLFSVISVLTNLIILVFCDSTKQQNAKGVYTLQKLTENITHLNEIEDSYPEHSYHYGQKRFQKWQIFVYRATVGQKI